MKRSLQLLTIVCISLFIALSLYAGDKSKSNDNLLRKSELEVSEGLPTFPTPFNKTTNPPTAPPVSTGYYFVDSEDDAPLAWRPVNEIQETDFQSEYWRRILPGPRMRDSIYWIQNTSEGLRYFRNPAFPTGNRSMFSHGEENATDSTDDAFAGPIPIKFDFYFNGIRYDSFYVSTNGLIALTNRRYFYDNNENRYIPDGETSCYDPMSMDWFARTRSGDGLNDATPDNFGYQFAVCGNAPNTAVGGIRKKGVGTASNGLASLTANQKAAVIAPFYGDLQLSQYNPKIYMPDDFGQVWYKRTPDGNKLIIYFKNAALVNKMRTRYGDYPASALDIDATYDLRPNDENYVGASAQVVLDRADSSITIHYDKFVGQVAFAPDTIVSAQQLFLYNTTAGVRGFARHVNYGQTASPQYPWHSEYEQYTHYYNILQDSLVTEYPRSNQSIKFKQWQNTLRVTSISFRTRKTNPSQDLCYSQTINAATAWEYELLAGHERLGQLQPIAIIQNLTNNIQGPQGVNYQVQGLKFKARFKIINEVTRRTVYDRMVLIDSLTLATDLQTEQDCNGEPNADYCSATGSAIAFPGAADLDGIPPYGYVKVTFPPFDPDPNQANHIGRMRGFCIAEPVDAITNEPFNDGWPFDDTISVRFFVMKRLTEFGDDVSNYHLVFDEETRKWTAVPNALKWVSVGCEVVDGDSASYIPLPPQGQFRPSNFVDYNITDPDFSIDTVLNSPTILMNRLSLAGKEPTGFQGGDELRSFPIDMRGKQNSVLSLSIQRGLKQKDFPRGWADERLIGPEMRTITNGDPFSVWTNYTASTTKGGSVAIYFDVIDVEFARSSTNGIDNVTNLSATQWRYHPKRGSTPVTNMPAFEYFGGGGYIRGFDEVNKDSALIPPNLSGKVANGLRPDIYDDGIDFEYKRIFIPIPDTFITASDEAAANFRFRIKVNATNHQRKINCKDCIPDDDDPFLVDNVRILHPLQYTDLGISKVDVEWPYTVVPISQTGAIPIRVRINNNTSIAASTFLVKLKIFKQGEENNPENAIYCRTEQLPFLSPSKDEEIYMPNWNAKAVQIDTTETYVLVANLIMYKPDGTYGDLVSSNDTCMYKFTLRTKDVFAYDPIDDPKNDVPHSLFSNIHGRGLNLFGYNYGGRGIISEPSGVYTEVPYGVGDTRISGSGRIAVKFTLLQADTIKGYQTFFAGLNQAQDFVAFAVCKDQNGKPGDLVPNTYIYRERGKGDENEIAVFNQYITYLFEQPVTLNEGTYWVLISQLGQTGIELGASKSRMGLRTTSVYKRIPLTTESEVGDNGYNMMVDKSFRKKNQRGFFVNENYFCFENSIGSGNWREFMPTTGNPAYSHLHHYGITPIDGTTATLTRGTWIPMLRPYFGLRQYATSYEYNPCSDDIIPVTLITFNGQVRKQAVELYWETSSEINNSGFQIEKNVYSENKPEDWKQIGFVKGAGTSNTMNRYSFIDQEVVSNTTYQYRLRQVDKDGIVSCENYSKVVTLHYDNIEGVVLEQNQPNPFNTHTKINFRIPENSRVSLEIIDVYGNHVKTLVNSELAPNRYEYVWDGYNSNGEIVSTGTYIYRLRVADEVYTGKMSFIR